MLKTTVNLPAELVEAAKIHAVRNKVTFTQLLIHGLETSLGIAPVKKAPLSSFLKTFQPLPPLTDEERNARYSQSLNKKYG